MGYGQMIVASRWQRWQIVSWVADSISLPQTQVTQ